MDTVEEDQEFVGGNFQYEDAVRRQASVTSNLASDRKNQENVTVE